MPGTSLTVSGPEVAVGLGVGVLVVLVCLGATAGSRPDVERPRRLANLGRLVLHLWPVIVLTAVYPLVSPRMAGHEVAGVPLTSFILMVAVTVPWISQATCAPLYRMLQPVWEAGGRSGLRRAILAVLAGRVPAGRSRSASCSRVRAARRTRLEPSGGRRLPPAAAVERGVRPVPRRHQHRPCPSRRGRSAGPRYALPVVLAPTAWLLPPLCGLGVLVVTWVRLSLVRPGRLPVRPAALDLLGGLLLGSVLWADKFFYFLSGDGDIEIRTLFLSILPAVVAYNYYFVCLEPEMGGPRAGPELARGVTLRWLSPECSSMGRFVSRSLADDGPGRCCDHAGADAPRRPHRPRPDCRSRSCPPRAG